MRYYKLLCFLIFQLSISLHVFGLESLTDTWVSATKSQGGLQSILEFRKDGTVATTMAVMLEYRYNLKGSTLILTPKLKEGKIEETKYTVSIDGDLLHMQEAGSDVMTLKRIPGDPKKEVGIIGKWLFKKGSGETIYYIFTTDNQAYLRMPMPGATISSYKVNGDTIELHRDNEVTTMKISVTDDLLILRTLDNKEYKYTRMSRFH